VVCEKLFLIKIDLTFTISQFLPQNIAFVSLITWFVRRSDKFRKNLWSVNLKASEHSEDVDEDGHIKLKLIAKWWSMRVWTEFVWLRLKRNNEIF
jgi:hypothetical protein